MFIVSDIGIFVFCIQLFNAASSFDILICYLLKLFIIYSVHSVICVCLFWQDWILLQMILFLSIIMSFLMWPFCLSWWLSRNYRVWGVSVAHNANICSLIYLSQCFWNHHIDYNLLQAQNLYMVQFGYWKHVWYLIFKILFINKGSK